MRRVEIGKIRTGWRDIIASQGLVYNESIINGQPVDYWPEGPYYAFEAAEAERLYRYSQQLLQMCVTAGDYMVERCPQNPTPKVSPKVSRASSCTPESCLLSEMQIPDFAHRQIIRTWYDDDAENFSGGDFSPSIFGRFDLRYDGTSPPQLLEFNADTPTSLPESSIIQWFWHGDTNQGEDQWNRLDEALQEAWRRNITRLRQARPHLPRHLTIYFACDGEDKSGEDLFNTQYMMDVAERALKDLDVSVKFIWMSNIGAGDVAAGDYFYDTSGSQPEQIHVIYKLYPWEYMYQEAFAKQCFRDMGDAQRRSTIWIEPAYKMLWSNKMLLPVLWGLYKNDSELSRLLLPAYPGGRKPVEMTRYAKKPLLGREGANVTLIHDGEVVEANNGPYGEEGFIYQELALLPDFPDSRGISHHPVLGVWLIDGEPEGLGIRESQGLITNNGSQFIPHVIGSYL